MLTRSNQTVEDGLISKPTDISSTAVDAAQSAPMSVRPLSEADAEAWDQFVDSHPDGTPFHLLAWKRTIEESFGYRPYYAFATDGSRIRGVLPVFFVQNIIVGKVLISSPFAVYGGILADSQEAVQALHDYVVELGRQLGVEHIELRNSRPEQCLAAPNVDRYVAFSQALVPDEATLLESLPKKTRNLVRKALKQPFEMHAVSDLKAFEDLYATNMRRLGTPCFPSKYFKSLTRNFGDRVTVNEVRLHGKPMAASLCFLFHGDMHIYYAAADTRYNALGPNTYMYFDLLRRAGAQGLHTFDFGRCKRDTGVFEFKRHWNTTMRQLPYEIILIRRKELPNFSPANPKFGRAIQLWQLMPMPLARLIGPRIIRLFP